MRAQYKKRFFGDFPSVDLRADNLVRPIFSSKYKKRFSGDFPSVDLRADNLVRPLCIIFGVGDCSLSNSRFNLLSKRGDLRGVGVVLAIVPNL